MTPKEKAKELVEKHLTAYDIEPIAVKSALITINEMILVLPFTDKHKALNEYAIQMQKYLNQVKHEIEKL